MFLPGAAHFPYISLATHPVRPVKFDYRGAQKFFKGLNIDMKIRFTDSEGFLTTDINERLTESDD